MAVSQAPLGGDEKKISDSKDSKKISSLFEKSMVMSVEKGWIISSSGLKAFSEFLTTLFPAIPEPNTPSLITSLLHRYVPPAIKETTKTTFPLPRTLATEETLTQEIKKSNDIAVLLKNIWWHFKRNKQPHDQSASLAARLLLCEQMLAHFEYEANNHESTLNPGAIDRVYKIILDNLNAQKEWAWFSSSPLNTEIEKLKSKLSNIKQNFLAVREKRAGLAVLAVIASRYSEGDAKGELPVGSSAMKEAETQLTQVEKDLKQSFTYSEHKDPTSDSIINVESVQVRSRIAGFLVSEKFALKRELDKMQIQIELDKKQIQTNEKKLSRQELDGRVAILGDLDSPQNTINQQLVAISTKYPEVQPSVLNLQKQIQKLAEDASKNIQTYNAAAIEKRKSSSSSSREREKSQPKHPSVSGSSPLASQTFISHNSGPKEKKKKNSNGDEKQLNARVIAQEAKEYIRLRLDTKFASKNEVDNLFSEALGIFKNIEGSYGQIGAEIQKNVKRLRTPDAKINTADARKIVALLHIYTTAETYLKCKPEDDKEELYRKMQEATKNAASDLCAIHCDLISIPSSSPLSKSTFSTLPIHSHQAYVRYRNRLFYVNKIKQEYKEVKLTPQFDETLKPSNSTRILTRKELNEITSITGDTSAEENSNYAVKYNKPNEYCERIATISIISGQYLSEGALAKKNGSCSSTELGEKRDPYYDLFKDYEARADERVEELFGRKTLAAAAKMVYKS